MSQINVNPGGYRDSDSGVGTVLAVLLALVVIAFLVWAFAFGGFNSLSGAPAGSAPASSSSPSVNISPNVNVQPPANSGSTGSGTTGSVSGGATGSTSTGASGTVSGGATGSTTTKP